MDSRTFLAQTSSGSLYVATPQSDGRYMVERTRFDRSASGAMFGTLGSGRSISPLEVLCVQEQLVVTKGQSFHGFLPGTPVVGKTLVLDLGAGIYHMTSSVEWVGELEFDRSWVAELIVRAFRMGHPGWQRLLEEQDYEIGLEGVRDDSSGLTRSLRESVWQQFLATESRAHEAKVLSFLRRVEGPADPVKPELKRQIAADIDRVIEAIAA